jgi:peptidyl-prolyl cis-trans isomerase SurA
MEMKLIVVNQKVISPKGVFEKASNCPARTIAAAMLALLVATIALAAPNSTKLWAQETKVVDRIVAVVNNEIVTLYELNRSFAPYASNIKALNYAPEKERQTLFQVRQDILDKLIDSMLADQQVKRDRITVSQKEINRAIERVKEQRQMTDEQLRQGLGNQGVTMEEYRKEIEEQILRSKLVNREVKAKIVITKVDIKEYYESHREKYAGEKKYYLWNIFIKVPSNSGSSEINNARSRMEAILAQLKQGRSFESLVDELKNSTSAIQGTDLGLYRLDELSEQLRQVVKKMNTGEFSAVLEANFGFQILFVQKIEDTQAQPLAAVEAEIEELLYTESVDNKYQEWLEELRARSHIRIIN